MSLTSVGVIERKNTITVDGFSSAKTLKGAINEMARLIAKKFDEEEGKALTVKTNDEAEDLLTIGNYSGDEFGIELQEFEYDPKLHYYIMVRIVKGGE